MYLGKTYFSFKYGTYPTRELVKDAVEAGVTALALTNINTTCDAWDFVQYCREEGVRPILGAEIRNDNQLLYILIAANNRGFRWINEFLSEHLLEKKPFPERASTSAFFADLSDGFVIYPFCSKAPEELLENERIGVLPDEVGKLLKMPFASYPGKWIIRQPVTFRNKTWYNVHRLLRAIDLNTLLTKLPAEGLAGQREYFIPQ